MPGIHDLTSYMDALRAAFDAERAGDRRATLQYVFSGTVNGACYAVVADGTLEVVEGRHPAPTATATSDFDLWVRLIAYHLDPLIAYQEGLYRIDGDVEMMIESDSWFRR